MDGCPFALAINADDTLDLPGLAGCQKSMCHRRLIVIESEDVQHQISLPKTKIAHLAIRIPKLCEFS